MCVRFNSTVMITEEMIKTYALLSGDENPIHQDYEEAIKYEFNKPVAHGMLVMGLGAQIVNELSDKECSITEYEMNFINPVFVHDSVQLKVEIGSGPDEIKISGYVNGKIVVKGKATIEGEICKL